MEAELFVFSFFGEWVGYFRFICRPRLHLIARDPGTHLNQAERLTAKMSWIDQGIWEAGGWQGPIAQVEGSNPGLQVRLARGE